MDKIAAIKAEIAKLRSELSKAGAGPQVEMSYGPQECLHCRRTFDKKRAWAKYCSNECRMAHWQLLNRRKTAPGKIVAVGGKSVKPFDAIDPEREKEVQREIDSLLSFRSRRKR